MRKLNFALGGFFLTIALVAMASSAQAQSKAPPLGEVEFTLPIDCELGKTCFIQHYFDVDSSRKGRDYTCGNATYNGHNGVDFRLLSTKDVKRGVAVIAAAPGKVAGRWRGMMDQFFDPSKHPGFRGRECGNGVVVDHGNRWKTTYCHLRFRSIRVWAGKQVERGEILGYVGYTGASQFPHLHFSVRYNEERLDPFTGMFAADGCSKPEIVAKRSLWKAGTFANYSYRTGRILEAVFAAEPVLNPRDEKGLSALAKPVSDSPSLVFATRAMHLEAGDRLKLVVEGPGGFHLEQMTDPEEYPLPAQGASVSQKRVENSLWTKGLYVGRVAILRGGKIVDQLKQTFEMK
ncbi:MAG: M23 family metallopeptidase [Hyphomicrobiaceae bacterium]